MSSDYITLGNLRPRRPPREYLGEYTSRRKPKIPPADLMDPGHKARKNPSDNADLGFQAVGPALRIMQLNVETPSGSQQQNVTPYNHFILHAYFKKWNPQTSLQRAG